MDRTWTAADVGAVLQVPTPSDDKYSRGVLGMRTGSVAYPGAAVLGVEAAWRTGIGLVRYLGPDTVCTLVLQRRPESVTQPGRVDAWVIGSGTSAATRSDADADALREILRGDVPVVVDAGALDLVSASHPGLIVTPHAGEHARLRERLRLGAGTGDAVSDARETARSLGAVVVLKGATTIVAAPDGRARRIEVETSWLATAGTGDVLAGVIGALTASLASREHPDALLAGAASGVWLHSRAAALASAALGGGPITAMDVAAALPRAVAGILTTAPPSGPAYGA